MEETVNRNAQKHGGAAAVKALQQERPFAGLAQAEETAVIAELAAQGRGAIVEKNAVRLQTCANLYYNAFIKAIEEGKLDQAEQYIKIYGWLVGASLRAWAQVKDEESKQPNKLMDAAIKNAQEIIHGKDS